MTAVVHCCNLGFRYAKKCESTLQAPEQLLKLCVGLGVADSLATTRFGTTARCKCEEKLTQAMTWFLSLITVINPPLNAFDRDLFFSTMVPLSATLYVLSEPRVMAENKRYQRHDAHIRA